MKRQKTVRDLQLCEELAMSRPFPPFGNPLWQARKRAPRGVFLESSDAPGFIFRLSFADSDIDAQYETPGNRLLHAWNSSLMHVPQLSPVDRSKARDAADLHLVLYWLRLRKQRGVDIGDPEEDNTPNALRANSVLQPMHWETTHKAFPQIDTRWIRASDHHITASSLEALRMLEKRNTVLRLSDVVNLRPVPNAMMRSTDTAGLQHYQAAGVCSVHCSCIRKLRSHADGSDDDSDSSSDVSSDRATYG
jgi:hypothetical protein